MINESERNERTKKKEKDDFAASPLPPSSAPDLEVETTYVLHHCTHGTGGISELQVPACCSTLHENIVEQ